MARATAGSVSIQSVPDGVSGESVQLAVDITKGNALYDFVECVWTADDGTIVDTTSARVISFWALGATAPTAPTNVTTWNFAGNATWTRGGAQPSPTATLNVYKAIRIEHFDGTTPSATTFVSASWGDAVAKVADAVPVTTTRQRHIYRLSGAAPSDFDLVTANAQPDGITTDGTYFYVVDETDERVYVYTLAGARQTSREFDLHRGDTDRPFGITTDGTYLYVADLTDDHVYVYTLAGARQSSREFDLHNTNGNPTGITTDGTYLYVPEGDASQPKIYVYTLAGARQSAREFDLPAANNIPRGITTDGTYLYVTDTTDDKIYVYTLAGARQSSREFDLHNTNGNPTGITTDGTYFYVADASADKVFVYNPTNVSEVPTAPSGGTTTAAYIPSGWQATEPDPTSTQAVYRATRTETFSNNVFQSATVYGSVTKVGDKVAPTANTQTITLPSSAFTRNEFGNRWAFSTTSRTTNPSIIQALRPNATEVYFHSLYIWKDGRVQLEFNYDLSVGDSRADLTTTFEATGGFTLTAGNNTLVVALNGADTSEPYLWTPSNSDDVTAFYNAVTTATEATLVLTDNIMAVPVTTTRTRFIYTLATSLPSAPAGGTTTAAYIPSGWQATEPDPTSTQAVYRATRTETFTNGVFTSATVYGSVTKVADKVFVPADFDLASGNGTADGLTTDGTYLYISNDDDNHVYVYTLAGARQSTREFDLHNDNTISAGITTDGTYLYVVDRSDDHVYVYTLAGARQSTREFNLHNDNGNSFGITTDGTYLYVVDIVDDHVYVYTLAGARQSTREFNLHNDNGGPQGITTDGTYLYVVDQPDNHVYVYTLAGARQSTREFDLRNALVSRAAGITTHGTYFYVADNSADKIFVYPMS